MTNAVIVVDGLLQRLRAFKTALVDGRSEEEIVQRYAELKAETPAGVDRDTG